ncbi:unnamed protein product [Leptosia nina]|uniref:Uncharacterized protein n=1 Tax=Leptosia nina TaxID=320188 RepID=A0AAV1JLH1_9NEOP
MVYKRCNIINKSLHTQHTNMSSLTFFLLCIQACLIQNALSTLIGPALYGNGFGLGNSCGAGLTAASAELAGWYGGDSPASYNYGPRAIEREMAAEYAYAAERTAEYEMARSPAMWNAPFAPAPFAPAPFAPAPFAPAPFAPAPFAPAPYAPAIEPAAYGGEGVGDVAVAGEMPVAGTTMVAGQVPILGAVRFAGDLPAGGVVTIAGSCGCGNRYI